VNFDERNEGDYRIYAGALEVPGGYVAAMVVNRLRGNPGPYRGKRRDISISGGHRWPSAQDALRYALARASEVIRTERY
jgi:hypothetical protein